jgi:hypothetical protein
MAETYGRAAHLDRVPGGYEARFGQPMSAETVDVPGAGRAAMTQMSFGSGLIAL